MKAYFIGGLGCNTFYPQDFFDHLSFPVEYLDLYQENIASLSDLEAWFDRETGDDEILLIAHSLGANFAVYLANRCTNIQQLILLDGGYVQMDLICSLEEEVQGAEEYLTSYRFETMEEALVTEQSTTAVWSANLEKAVRAGLVWDEISQSYISNLSFETVKNLLSLRRQVQGQIQQLQAETLLLIPKKSVDTPSWVSQSLQDLPAKLQLQEIEDASHDIYLDQPEAVAEAVLSFRKLS